MTRLSCRRRDLGSSRLLSAPLGSSRLISAPLGSSRLISALAARCERRAPPPPVRAQRRRGRPASAASALLLRGPGGAASEVRWRVVGLLLGGEPVGRQSVRRGGRGRGRGRGRERPRCGVLTCCGCGATLVVVRVGRSSVGSAVDALSSHARRASTHFDTPFSIKKCLMPEKKKVCASPRSRASTNHTLCACDTLVTAYAATDAPRLLTTISPLTPHPWLHRAASYCSPFFAFA